MWLAYAVPNYGKSCTWLVGRTCTISCGSFGCRTRTEIAFIPEEFWDIHANFIEKAQAIHALQKYQDKALSLNEEQTNQALAELNR